MYEIIRTISSILRGLKFENSRTASIYYVNLIINFPTNLQNILNEANAIYGNEIHRQALQAGRAELLKNGFIARTYFTEDADVDFDREMYLPVNPEIIWKENQDKVKVYWKQSEDIDFRKAKIKELHEHYLKNFKKYGLGIERGSISGLFNLCWMTRTMVNNQNYNFTKRIDTMMNSLELYMVPDYFEHYKKMFERGLTERVLFDPPYKDFCG